MRRGRASLPIETISQPGQSHAAPSWITVPQAASKVALQAKQRDHSTLSFSEVETLSGKHLEHAGADTWRHEGRLVTSAHDEQGRRFLVLDVGSRLVAIPSQRRDLGIGSRVEARLERTPREQGRASQASWQVIDRERERDRGRGR